MNGLIDLPGTVDVPPVVLLRMSEPPGRSTLRRAYSPCRENGPQRPAASRPQNLSSSPMRPVVIGALAICRSAPLALGPYWKNG